MKLFSQEEGFSLIEVLVAIALLALISVSFLTLFTSAYAGIFLAKRESEALFSAQKDVEVVIDPDGAVPESAIISPGPIFIDFPGSLLDLPDLPQGRIKVGGEKITVTVEETEEGRSTSLTLFIPDP